MKKLVTIFAFVILNFFTAYSQEYNLPLNQDYQSLFESDLYKLNSDFHTSIRPYKFSDVLRAENVDSLMRTFYFSTEKRELLYRKVRTENLLRLDSGKFNFTIDPLFNIQYGKDLISDSAFFFNGRGFQIQGSLGEKLSFFSSFMENQASFPLYLENYVKRNGVVPGQGTYKMYLNKFDFAYSSGYLSYSPSRYFNFQFGHGKNFFGDGYRSLLLSDNSFNYPFLKITTTVWKIKYVNLFAEFLDIKNPVFQGAGNYYRKKYLSAHYLSYNVSKRFNLSLYEAVIWKAQDTIGYRGIDFNYLNPVVFYRPVEFAQGSPDNVLMGLNMSFKVNDRNILYGQVLIDEFKLNELKANTGWHGNKYGLQGGVKCFNFLFVKNLNFQSEVNFARPFTYSEADPLINYAHYSQPLAHPLGSNFVENISFLRYRYKSFYSNLKFQYAIHGRDTAGLNNGNNLYLPYTKAAHQYENYLGQPVRVNLFLADFRVGYIVNPRTNLNIELGFTRRVEEDIYAERKLNYFYFAIKTAIFNNYYDL